MILMGLPLCETINSLMDFHYIASTFKCGGLSVFDFWRTLHKCKHLGWIDFWAEIPAGGGDLPLIDIDEYLHYSRLAKIPIPHPLPKK